MKMIIESKGYDVNIGVEREDENEIISLPGMVALLELSKDLVIKKWKEQMNTQAGEANVENNETN